jgi:hypothetical protein
MIGRRVNLALLTALIAALILVACGQESRRISSSAAINPQSPASFDLSDALAELDAMQTPKGAEPAVFAQLKAALRAALIASGEEKLVSTPPTGPANAVPDLTVTDTGGGTADITWHYYNLGDYNQDGVVGIADITPLAMHFGEGWSIGQENTLPAVVDGSGDGTVNIADVTPIAMNFGVEAMSYSVESCATESGAYANVSTVLLTSGLDAATGRMRLVTNRLVTPSLWYRVVPADSASTMGVPSNSFLFGPAGVPVASIVPDITGGYAPLAVNFDASGSTDDGTIVRYEWDWQGDGIYDLDTGAVPTTSRIYEGVGSFNPTVRVTDNDALQATASVAITTTHNPAAPTAVIVPDFTEGYAPILITFVASGSTDSDGAIVKYEWDWESDGIYDSDTGATPTQGLTFVTPRLYTMTVRVTDNDGLTDIASTNVTINLSTWTHTWGGADWDNFTDIDVYNQDGSIYVVGETSSFGAGATDIFISRYLPDGTLAWSETWGGTEADTAGGIGIDPWGDVYVSGTTNSFGLANGDGFLLKLDGDGNMLWQKNFGTGDPEDCADVAIDIAGNSYVVGYTGSGYPDDAYICKFDSTGANLWQKIWNLGGEERGVSVVLDNDSNAYIAGSVSGVLPVSGVGVLLLKYDTDGNAVWGKVWDAAGDERPHGIASNGLGLYITGQTYSFGSGDSDVLTLKYDINGNFKQQYIWGGAYDDSASSVLTYGGGMFYVAGYMNMTVGVSDLFVLRYDWTGTITKQEQWFNNHGESAAGMTIGSDGGLCIFGAAANASGAWSSVSQTIKHGPATASTVTGQSLLAGFAVSDLTAAAVLQGGIIDTGAGYNDALIMKVDTSTW